MSDAQKVSVLLVDDDKFLLEMYGMKFSGAGYAIQTCLSAAQALELLRGGFSPAVILFDITMPDTDGFAFLKELSDRGLAPSALRIALTNQSDETEKKKVFDLGASAYIVKATMIPSEVVNTVAKELAKKGKND
jgi:CheY-like chemotaxis protein